MPEPAWTSLREVAVAFGVALQTARAWRSEGLPGTRNRYPCTEVVQWYLARAARGAAAGDRPGTDWKERGLRAQALRRELDIRKQLAELVPAEAAKQEIRGFARYVVDRLRGMANRLAGALAERSSTEVRQTLEQWFNRFVTELIEGYVEGERRRDGVGKRRSKDKSVGRGDGETAA